MTESALAGVISHARSEKMNCNNVLEEWVINIDNITEFTYWKYRISIEGHFECLSSI